MKNPFMKYVAKEKREDIFHSSTYGKAQSGIVMGTSSNKTFTELKRARENRKIVQGYEKSGILNQAATNGPRAKVFTPPSPGGNNAGAPPPPSAGVKK